jgi:hypothetical protein
LRSITQFLTGHSEQALADVNEAVLRDGKDQDSYLLRALLATASGDHAQAAEDGAKYLELSKWTGRDAGEAAAVTFFAKASKDSEESAVKFLDQRLNATEPPPPGPADPIVLILKKNHEKPGVEITSKLGAKDRANIKIVDAWTKLRGTEKNAAALEQLKAYVNTSNPLDPSFLLANAVIRSTQAPKPVDVKATETGSTTPPESKPADSTSPNPSTEAESSGTKPSEPKPQETKSSESK